MSNKREGGGRLYDVYLSNRVSLGENYSGFQRLSAEVVFFPLTAYMAVENALELVFSRSGRTNLDQ